ncbi:hypothetical protein E2C01_074569 [Portunus trituberculatus]|uniref:Uncharacterized protein n=1 Tax=Portunus trituberculatus TaxID=210409 RepID=A0A5B7IDH5_PORTR|nr:hypothetical protein [Portunus trituberculatus]
MAGAHSTTIGQYKAKKIWSQDCGRGQIAAWGTEARRVRNELRSSSDRVNEPQLPVLRCRPDHIIVPQC